MPEPMVTNPDRDVRQRGLVPPEQLVQCDPLVIGVGAIGRQVALQLTALGASRLTLFDDDTVQPENLAPQGYWPDDLNRSKVQATTDICQRIYPLVQITALAERFKRSTPRDWKICGEPIIFCCVDSIVTRRMIWESVRSTARFFVDGRMSAEVIRILAADDPITDINYGRTLFAGDEAYSGACTARSTIYTASIAAGLMVHQFCKWLRGLRTEPDLTLNLLAAELTAGSSR
jgi:molybdopterin-synthase adenylyltransferase